MEYPTISNLSVIQEATMSLQNTLNLRFTIPVLFITLV